MRPELYDGRTECPECGRMIMTYGPDPGGEDGVGRGFSDGVPGDGVVWLHRHGVPRCPASDGGRVVDDPLLDVLDELDRRAGRL